MADLPIQITNLDFSQIKDSLKERLRSQSEFQDFDFEGSGMAILLDILASNTVYNAYYLHMVANEMFLDTALWRKDVVSRAKAIGYTPRSRTASTATLTLEFDIPLNQPSSITIPAGTKFTSVLDGKVYTFETRDVFTAVPVTATKFRATNVKVYEGTRLTHKFTVDNQNYTPQSRFVIPNTGVDLSLMKVSVQPTASNSSLQYFIPAKNFTEIKSTDAVYFTQETDGSKYEVYFGDGIVGKNLAVGNVVIVDYVVCSGSIANKLQTFGATSSINSYQPKALTTSVSSGGEDEETVESIKFLAPLLYQAQERAVTVGDYEAIIRRDFPHIDSVRVWGGEDNVPAIYGKVFVCVKPKNALVLSPADKNYISEIVLKRQNVLTINVDIVDPDYLKISVKVLVKYKSNLTNDPLGVVKQSVISAIEDYGTTELEKFDSYFRYSKLVRTIDAAHTSIQNSLTQITIRYRLNILFNVEQRWSFNFSNAIDPVVDELGNPSLLSSGFTYLGYTCYFDDDSNGNVRIFRLVDSNKVIVKSDAGTIDYTTGEVNLSLLAFSGTASGGTYIDFSVRPSENDVVSKQNQILLIDTDSITVDVEDEAVY